MKFIREAFHKWEPHFEHGGKWSKWHPFFDAFYTFLLSPRAVTQKGPHVRDALDSKRYMGIVILALIPCLLFGIYNAGYQASLIEGTTPDFWTLLIAGAWKVLPIVAVSYGVGLFWEFLFAIIRRHEVNEGFLVTGMLFPLILPATIPLWQVAVGITFGVIIGKEVFGGTGRNFLNPALTARAFLFFAYPAQISGDVWIAAKEKVVDVYSGATALSVSAAVKLPDSVTDALISHGFTWKQLFMGFVPGSIGETSVICVLIGAALLIVTGIGSWRTMVGCVVGLVATSALFSALVPVGTVGALALPPQWHLVMGGFAFGAVFMATDPVSSPSLNASKWVYGILIGALTVIIRAINPAYPEGVMLSILLMNVFAPLIDHVFVKRQLRKRIPNVI
jgi:Na+-transporting NADH:ubiquinone oxidoreductase subunit B